MSKTTRPFQVGDDVAIVGADGAHLGIGVIRVVTAKLPDGYGPEFKVWRTDQNRLAKYPIEFLRLI